MIKLIKMGYYGVKFLLWSSVYWLIEELFVVAMCLITFAYLGVRAYV